ncbi:MAG: polyphosphate kinase 1 [Trueperaceae bacterium]|nr:MAG: polyphosphate kinase 1 [Trueperaceae bacterium]
MPRIDLRDPRYYFNRELSWLKFNERVLEEAKDERNPLLERLKFLAIFSTNLDEFIMIRYAGLKEQVAAGIGRRTADGMTPDEQLQAISDHLHPVILEHQRVLCLDILPALESRGIALVPLTELSATDKLAIEQYFHQEVFPVLTPLAVDSSHPFPRLPNLSFSLLLEVFDPERSETKLAVIQVPSVLPRFFRLPGKSYRFVTLEDIIKTEVGALFPGHEVKRLHGFRITRNADIEIAEDEADDLLQVIEDEVRRRRWGDAVRLEVSAEMPKLWLQYLRNTLGLTADDVYAVPKHLSVGDFMELASLGVPELRDEPFVTRLPTEYRNESSVFDAVQKQDVFIHHPFHDFDAVLNMLEEAADDPDVLAIKQTLYRVGRHSPVVAALAKAAGNGKLVTALVELKARFDEENNIVWARELERAGVHVVYGVPGLKTHCKSLLIVRREGNEIRRYVHLGTGNYNPGTSTQYTDMALLSCDPDLTADSSELFNYLTGFSKQKSWRKLWVAPDTLRTKLVEAIDRETKQAKAGDEAHIIAKMNSLVDPEVIRALYRASRAGTKIDLVVRGICCLRPGVEGVSENIHVRSVVGRFLEHSRAFYFRHGGEENLYLGSADWMQRNLNGRIETIFPLEEPRLKKKVMQVFDLLLRDNEKARVLRSDGTYCHPKRKPGQNRLNAQDKLLEISARRLALSP